MIALGVFTTHAIACFVAVELAWTEYIYKRIENSNRKVFWEYAVRTVVVFITC